MGRQEHSRFTASQRRALARIESSLQVSQPSTLAAAATMILQELDRAAEHAAFQERLKFIALIWRQKYEVVREQMNRLDRGEGARLYRLSGGWAADNSRFTRGMESDQPFDPPRMRPSLRPRMPRALISDDEVAAFERILDEYGVERVFAPGARMEDGRVVVQPLIVLGEQAVDYTSVAVQYEGAGRLRRSWDPRRRHPEIALGIDLALLAAAAKGKWTYQVSDRYCFRLPGWHKYHPQGGRRPAWRQGTRKLAELGLIKRVSGRTWTLTEKGRAAASQVALAWREAAGAE